MKKEAISAAFAAAALVAPNSAELLPLNMGGTDNITPTARDHDERDEGFSLPSALVGYVDPGIGGVSCGRTVSLSSPEARTREASREPPFSPDYGVPHTEILGVAEHHLGEIKNRLLNCMNEGVVTFAPEDFSTITRTVSANAHLDYLGGSARALSSVTSSAEAVRACVMRIVDHYEDQLADNNLACQAQAYPLRDAKNTVAVRVDCEKSIGEERFRAERARKARAEREWQKQPRCRSYHHGY